jgi:carboxyl-terminal processing protease
VLDLRGCPGGQLEVAVDVASAFLPLGTPVVTLERAAGAEQALVTTAAPVYEGPLVVLVDRATASGAEILAGAIQSQQRGLVAGEATYGKQTAETIFGLRGGYAAKLSTAFFRRPGSQVTGGSGFPVRPDVHLAAPMAMAQSQAQLASMGQGESNADLVLQAAASLLVWRFGDGGKPR